MRHSHRRPVLGIAALLVAAAVVGCGGAPITASVPPSGTCSPVGSLRPVPTPSPAPSLLATDSARPAPPCTPTPGPTPRPTPTSPAPTATPAQTVAPRSPAPSPTAVTASRLVSHGSRTSKRVALTYDMGGRVGDAIAIMDWLVAHDVHASVFMTGAMADNVSTDAGRVVLGIIDAHPGQFTLGNHSYTHRDFRTLTAAQIRDELRRTEIALGAFCSQDLHPFFRPPGGGSDADVLAAVGAAGYRDTVTWDVDTIDWRPVANDPPGPTADQIVTKVLASARNGSIVLNHLGGYHTDEALPRVVAGLRAAGFELVTLDELLGPA